MSVHWTEQIVRTLERENSWYRRAGYLPAGGGREIDGVNLAGYLRDESGWGAAGRGYARAMRAADVPLSLLDLSDLSSNRSGDTTIGDEDGEHPYAVNLVCVDAGQHYAFLQRAGEGLLRDRYSIGAWAWELPRFPVRWLDRFAYYDEIWVTTSFIARALAPVAPVPVVCLPPPLTSVHRGSREAGRLRLGAGDEFVFLFVFDVHSHMERKNPLAAVDAFRHAFEPSDPVRLVIKSVNGKDDPDAMAELRRCAEGQRIEFHDGYWSSTEVADLMAACDGYLSLHRSEGTGLTITDAMAAGKPVVATGWSGNMDFMTVANSYPVRYELVTLPTTVGPYAAGETWADPSVEHAAELMRRVVERPEEARAIGRQARLDLERDYSPAAVGELARERLNTVVNRGARDGLRAELERYFAGYRTLAARICLIVEGATPASSTVAVISKGDGDLLGFEDREGWHLPRTVDGTFAGYHPADSASAVSALEDTRQDGADFLVVPATSRWWLSHYEGLRDHLLARYRPVWDDESCIIYDLRVESPVEVPA